MSAMQIVLDAYVGRSTELIQCEGYLREIITMIHNDHSGSVAKKRTVTRDAEPCKKLEQTLATSTGKLVQSTPIQFQVPVLS